VITSPAAVEGEDAGLAAVVGGDAVVVLLVALDGLDSGDLDAVWLVLPPFKSHAAAKTITAASSAIVRPLPLIFC